MTEKERIIKDFLEDWYDIEQFYKEHPDLQNVNFKTIISFLNEIQLNEDDNISDVEHMFLHWIQGQYLYSKTKAEAIIEYREKNGDFKKKEDITKVHGIGKATFEKIKDKIEV